MKKLIVVTVLFSLSLAANAYVQNCFYGREFVNGQLVNTCKKCDCKKGAKKAADAEAQKAALKAKQDKLAAQQAAALQAKKEAEAAAALQAQRDAEAAAAAAAAKKAQQEKDAAALAAVGKVQTLEDEISVVLSNDILFELGKTELSDSSKQTLNYAVEILNQIPERSLIVEGHTDSTGPEEFNMKLSEQRAKIVYDYMLEKGLQMKEVNYKGYGETRPVADNETKEGRIANRRVEFRIK